MTEPPKLVNRAYIIEEQIGKGEFGTVYKGRHHKNGTPVAIKMENVNSEIQTLKHEATIMNYLHNHHCSSIPSVYWYGIHEELYRCLIMQYYKCSLHEYSSNKNINPTILGQIMARCIQILEEVHDVWVVHRDIKPQNFMIGEDKNIYLIDFGMATFYVNDNKEPIINDVPKEYIVGSPKYASYYVHCGISSQRRDDLISLGYMYIFMKYKGITWDDFQTPLSINEESLNNVGEIHVKHPRNILRKYKKQLNPLISELQRISYNEDCFAITKYMEYCYRLSPTTKPNYSSLVSLFV